MHDPAVPPGRAGCYGLAWGVEGYANTVVVIRSTHELFFRTGGWYVQVCIPDNLAVSFTDEDMGRIVANWLEKTYGTQNMKVVILK